MLTLSRRGHPRYPIHRIVSYHHEDQSVLTLTLDLGLGGMKIKTYAPLPRDECLRFRLVLGVNSIWLKGRVAYSRLSSDHQAVSGIEFIELSKGDQVSLGDYLSSLERMVLGSRGEVSHNPN